MKKLKLTFIFLLVIFFMPTPSVHASEGQLLADEINKENARINETSKPMQSADSLGIFPATNGQYYVYCRVCPIQTSNGFLVMAIIDTLKFIDPDIPQTEWVNAYISGNYSYRWKPKKSTIKFEQQEFRIDNCWDNTRAIIVSDSLKSSTIKNVIRNDKMNSIQYGKFMIFGLLIIGLLTGLWIKNLNKKNQIITFIVALVLITFFICIMFNGTLLALSIPLGSFILGNLLAFAIFAVLHFLRRKA